MSGDPRILPRASASLPFIAIALASLAAPRTASAQPELETIRSEMEESMQRLGEMSMGLFRVTMQDPNLDRHTTLITNLLESVRTDLDYVEALLELYGMASDPAPAGLVVIRELDGIRDRMQLDAYEQHVRFEHDPASTSRPLQVVEENLLTELQHAVELFDRARELAGQAR